MEVSSISSSANSALIAATTANSQSQSRVRQTEQDKQTQQPQQTQNAQQTQSSRAVDEGEASARARSETETNRPSVNTSGQVVGTQVNTTA